MGVADRLISGCLIEVQLYEQWKEELNLFDWLYKIIKNFTGSTGFQNVGVGRVIGVTALTGFFFYKKRYGRFTSTRKSDRNNETTM